MENTYNEIDAALDALNYMEDRSNKEFDEAVELVNLLERNDTIGLTLEDGKRLKKLGINVELEELGPNRIHLGNESMLTESGKTGLYGLAIGALIVVLGFIIKKIFSWFKGSSSSSGGSGSKSNTEKAKTVPSMSENPSNMIKLPKVLVHDSDFLEYEELHNDFLSYSQDAIKSIVKEVAFEPSDDASKEEEAKKATIGYVTALVTAVKALGYKIKSDKLIEIKDEIKGTSLEDLPYGKISSSEVFINQVKFQIDDGMTNAFDKVLSDLEKIKKDNDVATTVGAQTLRNISSCIVMVIKTNFIPTMAIAKELNLFLDKSDKIYDETFSTEALETVMKHKETAPYFKNVDVGSCDSLTKAYETAIKAGKGAGLAPFNKFKELDEEIKKFEKRISDKVEDKSDSKKSD